MVAAVGWGNQSTKLLMSRKEMATVSREIDEKRLLAGRRLALVVDLDKTILHTTTSLVAEEWARTWRAQLTELGPTAANGQSSRMFTRLRPGLAGFLDTAHKLFELQVFTFGTRRYAEEILKLVDPTKK
jgi:RNA polymerase II subunit A-like phosphatase